MKSYYYLKEKIEIVFEGKKSSAFTLKEGEETLKRYPSISQNNYRNVEILINQETEKVEKLDAEVRAAKEKLRETADDFSAAEKICGGTYVQGLVGEERKRREANYIPNGTKKS